MQPPYQNEIVCGDSALLLRAFPSNSVDLVITSPPYYKCIAHLSAVASTFQPHLTHQRQSHAAIAKGTVCVMRWYPMRAARLP